MTLCPPVAALLSSRANMYNELSQYWTIATLIDQNGETLSDQLGGRVSDSAHPMPSTSSNHRSRNHDGSRDQAYFYFPDLVIYYPGRYRIRVMLMRMDFSYESSEGVAVVEDYADSHSITVEEGAPSQSRPSKCPQGVSIMLLTPKGSREREFLRILGQDGQDVPSFA